MRLDLAKKQNLPAYTIFHDSSLIKMSKFMPKNEQEFLEIDGVGPAKVKKYAELFLKLINDFTKTLSNQKNKRH